MNLVLQTKNGSHRKTLPLNSFVLNPFNEDEILTFDVQDPWIKEMGEVFAPGFQTVTVGQTVAGRRRAVRPPMGFYLDAEHLRKLLFADFPDFIHPGGAISHPLVRVIPDGVLGAGSIVVRHAAALRDGDIPMHLRDHVEIEAFRRKQALEALDALGFVRSGHGTEEERDYLT